MRTNDVILTQVADTSVKYELNLATGKSGAPGWNIGKTPMEIAQKGQRGTIRIESQHGGSGQKVARDFKRYMIANGWLADRQGVLIPRGAKTDTVVSTVAAEVAAGTRRGAIFSVAGEPYVIVTPKMIYENIVPVAKKAPPESCVFTGSHARFGNRHFFGAENEVTAEACIAAVRIAAGEVVPITENPLDSGSSTSPGTAVTARALTSGSGDTVPVTHQRLAEVNSTVVATTYATASISPTGNRLLLASVESDAVSGAPAAPTLAGCGVTWVQVATVLDFSNGCRLTLFRGLVASPSAGAVTATFAASQNRCKISISEFANVDTSGTNGSGAIVQSATNQSAAYANALTVTLAAFGNSANATYGAFIGHGQSGPSGGQNMSPGTGFTEVSDLVTGGLASERSVLFTEWRADNDTSVDARLTAPTASRLAGIAVEVKASGGTASAYTTAVISPTGNYLVLAAVESSIAGGAPAAPTLAGCGITWVSEESVQFLSNERRLTIFRGLVASPSAGAVTITFGTAQDSCRWSIVEFAGVDTGGTNGSAACVQSVSNTSAGATTLTVTLAGFGSASNGTYGAFATNASSGITPGSGFTELHDVTRGGGLETEWKSSNDTSVDATDSLAASVAWGAIGIEIKAAVSGGSYLTNSFTPTADRLVLAAILNNGASTVTPGAVSTSSGPGISLTFSHTVAAGDNRCLVVSVGVREETGDADPVVSVTYGGVPLTFIGRARATGGAEAELWYMVAPAVGTADVVITGAAGGEALIGVAQNFTGVNQTTPIGTPASAVTTGSNAPSVVVTSATGELVVDAMCMYDTPTADAATVGAGQTQDANLTEAEAGAGKIRLCTSHENGAAGVTMSWTTTGTPVTAIVGVALKGGVITPVSVAGNNLTWVEEEGISFGSQRLSVWRAMGDAPVAGPLTIEFGAPQTAVRWAIAEFAGVNTSGTNGSGAIVQSLSTNGTATSLTVTLAAFADSNNAAYGAFGANLATGITPGSGFTEIHDVAASSYELQTEWKASEDITVDASGASSVGWVGIAIELARAASGEGDYTDAGFHANYVCTIGSRMFRLRHDASDELWYASWTDELNTDDPEFSTEYPVTGAKRTTGDLVSVGGQALAGISTEDLPAEFLVIDTEGNFTPVLPEGLGVTNIVAAGAFFSGQAWLMSGSPRITWFEDALHFSLLNLNALPPDDALSTAISSALGGISGLDDTLWAVANNQILYGTLRDEWAVNQFEALSSAHSPLAIRVWPDDDQIKVDVLLRTASQIFIRTYLVYNNVVFPAADADAKAFNTSIYQGDVWTSKKFLRIRGYATRDAGTLTIAATVDGAAAGSGTVTATGPFAIDLDAGAIGRGVLITLSTTDFMGAVELPLEIDYFYLPVQKDIIRIPVVAGRHTLNRAGTPDLRSRKDLETALSAIVDSPQRWTMTFWDNRDAWTVIPLDATIGAVEGESMPGNDVSVVWLTLQRI